MAASPSAISSAQPDHGRAADFGACFVQSSRDLPCSNSIARIGDAALLADLEYRDDVVVLDGGHEPGFAEKPIPTGVVRRLIGLHDLEGDRAAQGDVFRLKHVAHAALAQQAKDAIVAEPADLVRLDGGQQKGIAFRVAGAVPGRPNRGRPRRRTIFEVCRAV